MSTFDVLPLRFGFTARETIHFPPGTTSNVLRGSFGRILKSVSCAPECSDARQCEHRATCAYGRLFEPAALNGEGPLEIDFKQMGERASRVQMTRCEIRQIEAERVSGRTGQRHSLGGFVGLAEYEGDLAEFIPYLEIARWTGVGRQTVWGKGQIACETF